MEKLDTLLCTTKDGSEVFVDLDKSHAATHLKNNPGLKDLVVQILKESNAEDFIKRTEVDTRRKIGTSDLVETTDTDDIVYAKRLNRTKFTRFTKSQGPKPTTYLSIELTKISDRKYQLYTAYPGRTTPPFPGEENETPESKPYWSKHALAWGKQEIQPGTETKEVPW